MADTFTGPRLTVIGEALIDLVPGQKPSWYEAKPGGSPFNVAIGLARLGHRTTLMARLADDSFGDLLRGHAAAENIDLGYAPVATEPTTLAVVGLDRDARASYSFYLQGTADWQWTDAETARLPGTPPSFTWVRSPHGRLRGTNGFTPRPRACAASAKS